MPPLPQTDNKHIAHFMQMQQLSNRSSKNECFCHRTEYLWSPFIHFELCLRVMLFLSNFPRLYENVCVYELVLAKQCRRKCISRTQIDVLAKLFNMILYGWKGKTHAHFLVWMGNVNAANQRGAKHPPRIIKTNNNNNNSDNSIANSNNGSSSQWSQSQCICGLSVW